MLDHEDLKWIATSSTELNSMLQQISRYSDLARQHKGEYNYVEILGERVELASTKAQDLFDRVTSKILEAGVSTKNTARKSGAPAFSVMPPPAASRPLTELPKNGADSEGTIQPARAPSAPEFKILNPDGKRELILLVDDEVEISELASEMLSDAGYKVILAKDGFEALKIYKHLGTKIGLIILDFFLPIMDGDVVFDELRELNPKVTVVLSSGFAEQSKLGTMLSQGLRGFIPKPYTCEKLLEQVRSTLDAARQQQ
ncbi:MAG: response regulator [Chthoniobacterales bacterium]